MVPIIPVGYLGAALVLSKFVEPFHGFAGNLLFYVAHGACIAAATAFLIIGPHFISSPEVSLLIILASVLDPILVWTVFAEHLGQWTNVTAL